MTFLSPSSPPKGGLRVTLRNLCVLSYARGFTIWHYRAPTATEVLEPGYWADARESISPGDFLEFVTEDNRCGMRLFFPRGATATPLIMGIAGDPEPPTSCPEPSP